MRFGSLFGLAFAISLTACSQSSNSQGTKTEPVAEEARSPQSGDSAFSGSQEPASDPKVSESETAEGATAESGRASENEGELRLDQLQFAVPEGWQRKQPSSSFVLAEFALPKAEGDDADGRLTVSVAGGSVEANIERWRDQFGGKPDSSSEKKLQVDGLDVSLVDFAGEFNDQRGPFAPGAKRSGYRMLAAIIPVDGELHFVKATGPQATIESHSERFQKFIESAKKRQ